MVDPHVDQLPVDLRAQLMEHCTGIAEVRVRIPVQAFLAVKKWDDQIHSFWSWYCLKASPQENKKFLCQYVNRTLTKQPMYVLQTWLELSMCLPQHLNPQFVAFGLESINKEIYLAENLRVLASMKIQLKDILSSFISPAILYWSSFSRPLQNTSPTSTLVNRTGREFGYQCH